jgi:O-antigen ligase
VNKTIWQAARVVCLLLIAACLLGAAALQSQTSVLQRGVDLGSPLNRPQNIYGINIHLLEEDDPSQTLRSLKDAGYGWVRQEWDWQNTDWDRTDTVTSAIQAEGLGLVAVLNGSVPPDAGAFAAYAGEFAARYQDPVDIYQLWDEPNLEIGWHTQPSASDYAGLLQAAYTAIHEADPTATVLLAGLAPTVETGPKNLSDVLYLQQLYDLHAGDYFDAVAGKPYGFNTSPEDRTVDGGMLNFSRLILLREVMTAHGDGEKFLWGTNFGWNTQPSIWGLVSADRQRAYTQAAYARAATEWAWAGPLFLETPRPTDPPDDPHNGFAIDPALVVAKETVLHPGAYSADKLNAYAQFEGAWKFSELGADIPHDGVGTMSFEFVGDDLTLTVRRANYRAYLYVTIDGQPANALPTDSNNNAYIILTSPDLQPQVASVTLASGLGPGKHTAVIRADRGWDQWAIVSVAVGPVPAGGDNRAWLAVLAIAGLASAAVLFYSLRLPIGVPPISSSSPTGYFAQTLTAALISLVLWLSAWVTWGDKLVNMVRQNGEALPFVVTILTAGLLYFSPFLILSIVSILALLVLFYLRPLVALPIIAFFIPFYLIPRLLFDRAFSMLEACTLLAVVALTMRLMQVGIGRLRQDLQARRKNEPRNKSLRLHALMAHISALDLAVLAFAIVCAASVGVADIRGVAIYEFRVVVAESVLFYGLIRVSLSSLFSDKVTAMKFIWLTIDFFLIGAVAVALYGLSNLITGENLITAEGGIARIRSIYGSPNNLGLYMGRAIPIAAAVALLGTQRWRRVAYGLALLPLMAAALLSFSRGALLFGIPASFIVILLFWGGRKAAIALAGLAGIGALAIIPLSRNPRFASLLDLSSGTSFFRINVWRSAWAMFVDHPLLGVGLDNFLYAYRGRYIQPEAWQEPNLPHAHNIFLDALTRTGALGFASLLAILALFYRAAVKCLHAAKHSPTLRSLVIGLLASMVNTLAHGMVDTGFWFVDLAFVFMMTLAVMETVRSLLRTETRQGDVTGII